MSIEATIGTFAGPDPIFGIADDVFTAMIDGESGHLRVWEGTAPALDGETHAWVDVHGHVSERLLLSTERSTADALARSLLGMEPNEPVSDEDFADALGEVANVVVGNVKALIQEPGTLGLPHVRSVRPELDPTAILYRLPLDWRGHLLVISLWRLP